MIFRQIIAKNGGCITYVFGCTQAGDLFVVDPKYETISEVISISESLRMKIAYIMETHTHADHLSGAKKLQSLTGANVYYHEESKVRFRVERMEDGQEIRSGNTKVKVLHTPGHTPDSVSLLIYDKRRDESWTEPWAVLTGDTLLVGSVGRVDIVGQNSEENLFSSLKRLRELPDYVEVYPAHTSGSACGFGISGKPISTIGFEKRFNQLFKIEDKETFLDRMNIIKMPKLPEFKDNIERNLNGVI